MNHKLIGGILLVVGTTIGAGILALPVTTSASGFITSSLALFVCWLLMGICALIMLEVNLWFPEGSHYISMVRATFGVKTEVFAWICMLLLLYALLSAYIAGGSDVLNHLLTLVHINLPQTLTATLFAGLLGWVVMSGTHWVDYANRGLMSIKLVSLVLLLALMLPVVHGAYLGGGQPKTFTTALMIMLTAFGYSTIIPSLRTYFNSDVKAMRRVILWGSGIPLICYIVWDLAILGTIPATGTQGLQTILASGRVTSELLQAISSLINSQMITRLAGLFSSICVITSFLGVALSLKDFLADGTKIARTPKGYAGLAGLTFLPPLLVVVFDPSAFILALNYAGLLCVILLVLFPVILVWRAQKKMNTHCEWSWLGHNTTLFILTVVGLLLLMLGVWQIIKPYFWWYWGWALAHWSSLYVQ